MHASSMQYMSRFLDKYTVGAVGNVLDVGSWGVLTYKPMLLERGWKYTGLDLAEGPNVDLVVRDPFAWDIPDSHYDLIVSGQVFEHVDFFWITFLEMARVLKRDGHIILIAPSRGEQHRWPVDCWRFYPDGYSALAKWARLELVEVNNPWKVDPAVDLPSMYRWGDTAGVFRKTTEENNPHLALLTQQIRTYLTISGAATDKRAFREIRNPSPEESYYFTELAAANLPLSSMLKALPKRITRKVSHLLGRAPV